MGIAVAADSNCFGRLALDWSWCIEFLVLISSSSLCHAPAALGIHTVSAAAIVSNSE